MNLNTFEKIWSFFSINVGIIMILVSLLLIAWKVNSWVSYFNIFLGIVNINLGVYLLVMGVEDETN
jgi:hypothetical protein